MLRYADKHFSRWQRFLLRLGIVKGMALRWLASLLGARQPGVNPREAREAYRQVIAKVLNRSGSWKVESC
jgi:hypothetical protein